MKRDELAIVKFSTRPTTSQAELLAADIVSRMSEAEFTGYNLKCLGSFFEFLPPRVGHNPALDAALRCLLHVHRQVCSNEVARLHEDFQSYSQALSLIRKDITRFQSKTPSETLCAAMLLSLYEVRFYNNDRTSVKKLTKLSRSLEQKSGKAG